MKDKIPPLDALIKLLDDEDETARIAMMQLILHYSSELDNILVQLQECDNQMLRKRSQQLQAITIYKRRRRYLHNILHGHEPSFYVSDALCTLHLLWFEKDSFSEIEKSYQELLDNYPSDYENSLEDLADYIQSKQFIVIPDSTENSELYMIGSVLNCNCGANAFMCALFLALNEDLQLNINLQVIMFEHRFYILDISNNEICDMLNHFEIRKLNFSDYKIFTAAQLLKYITSICFSCAINNDAFRFIQILGEILSPDHTLQSLPYPYGKKNSGS